MGVQKFVFFSIHNCDKHPEVPLMEIKYCTEKFLNDSGLNHITIRLCGFMQVMLYIIRSTFCFHDMAYIVQSFFAMRSIADT